MADEESKSLDIFGIKPVAEAANKLTIAALEGAEAFLSRICLPAAEEFGLLFRDRVHAWRTKNITSITQQAEKILDGLKDLIPSSRGPEADHWENTIADLVERESIIMQKVNEQQMEDALKGDSPDYFTLWESRN